MAVTRLQASEAIEEFKTEYKGLSQVSFVLLENHKDFHDHYGKHAAQAAEAWAGKLGAYSRRGLLVFSAISDGTQS